MRKFLTVFAISVSLLVSVLVSPAVAKNPECRFGTGTRAMRQTVWCVSHKLNMSVHYPLYVAYRESKFQARARNDYSGACGIYQHIPSYWPGRFATYYGHKRWGSASSSCYSGRTNIIVALTMAHRGGWGPWS